jgi:hypothetical protein
MTAIPLFTQPELEAAFALILPTKAAGATARRWWRDFATKVDERGYFLSDDQVTTPGLPQNTPQVVGVHGRMSEKERSAQERVFWSSISVDERVDLLMRFSSFHFALLALVSEDLYERMRLARKASIEQAATSRAQMRRIVAAIRDSDHEGSEQ